MNTIKIVINENAPGDEVEVIINCKQVDDAIVRILATLRELDKPAAKLTGLKDGTTYIMEISDVLYFDTVDKRTFIYTQNNVFESGLRLYELEERLGSQQFFRSSKSAIINIAKIKTIVPDFGGRLEVTLTNGERVSVSRQYAAELKSKLGM